MIDYSLTQAPFRLGLDEGTDPDQLPPGTLLVAQNVQWRKSGRLEKRQGFHQLPKTISSGGNITSARRLITRGNELALSTGSELYSYVEPDDQDPFWAPKGLVSEMGLSWRTSVDTTLGIRAADMAIDYNRGVIMTAWVSGQPFAFTTGTFQGIVFYEETDIASGAVVQTRLNLSEVLPTVGEAFDIRVLYSLSSGESFVIWRTSTRVEVYTVSTGTVAALVTDVGGAGFDAVMVSGIIAIAYTRTTGGVGLATFSSGAVPAPIVAPITVAGTASLDYTSIGLDASLTSNRLVVIWARPAANPIQFAIHNFLTLAQVVAATTIAATGGSLYQTVTVRANGAGTRFMMATSYASAAGTVADGAGFFGCYEIDQTGASTVSALAQSINVLSRPFYVGAKCYVFAGTFIRAGSLTPNPVTSGSDSFLLELTRDLGFALALPREVGKVDLLTCGYWLPGFVTNTVQREFSYYTLTPVNPLVSSQLSDDRQSAREVRVMYGSELPEDHHRCVTLGRETWFAGGVLSAYDGNMAQPTGFPHGAYLDTANAASAAGGGLATGTYLVNVTLERRSATGILHRGPTGTADSMVVVGPTGSLPLRITQPSISLTVSGNLPLSFEYELAPIYVSQVGGSVLYRATKEPSVATIYFTTTLTLLSTTVTTAPDANSPPLYTEGGELEDFQPPAAATCALYKGRIFIIDGGGRTVRYSKSFTANPGVAPGFHPDFRLQIDDDLTAIATMDERLFIFSETGIYYTFGDGPAPNGDGPFETPQRMQTDVGCTNPRGICSGPDGIFFVSGSEIHLLGRKLTTTWVGKPVQDLLAAYPTITSAVLVANRNQVRFTATKADGTSSIILVFDYVEGQWSHFTVPLAAVPIADATLWAGVYTFVTTDGQVYVEDSTRWLDTNPDASVETWVPQVIETANLHAAGPLAYHAVRRFRILGTSASDHRLTISVAFDGETSFVQPKTWNEGVDRVTAVGPVELADLVIGHRRKCASIRFRIEDAAPLVGSYGTGQGPRWSAMGIEVGVNKGFDRVAARQRK